MVVDSACPLCGVDIENTHWIELREIIIKNEDRPGCDSCRRRASLSLANELRGATAASFAVAMTYPNLREVAVLHGLIKA